MMAYGSQFVLAILNNGSPVREIGGTVHLPFHSEYKIRLKNKHTFLRAKARVWVDGRQVSNLGDFILNPNETLDLERFLDESMTSGRRFKFVPLTDGRVNDPTDSENGVIKVEFYREKKWTPPPGPIRPLVKRTFHHARPPSGLTYDSYNSSNLTSSLNVSNHNIGTSVHYFNQNVEPAAYVDPNAGATVEGGYSGQGFVYGSDFPTEPYPVTLRLNVRGLEQGHWDEGFINPAPAPKKMIKFCPHCGARRHRMADKFCHRCGTAYHPRYERERGRIVR